MKLPITIALAAFSFSVATATIASASQHDDSELAVEGAGAFQTLVDALAALQRAGLVRDDDTLTMARFIWAFVHGVAMLAIDGLLREPGAVDELLAYTRQRLRTAIAAGIEPAQLRSHTPLS